MQLQPRCLINCIAWDLHRDLHCGPKQALAFFVANSPGIQCASRVVPCPSALPHPGLLNLLHQRPTERAGKRLPVAQLGHLVVVLARVYCYCSLRALLIYLTPCLAILVVRCT